MTTQQSPEATEGAPAPSAPAPAQARATLGRRILGVVAVATGAFLLYVAVTAGEVTLSGPRLAPIAVTAGWTVLAAIYLVRQLVAPHADEPTDETEAEERGEPRGIGWLTPTLVVVALVGYVFALEPLGFVLASALFFIVAARILGSHHLLRDVITVVLLVLAVYLAFTRLLDINLPAGVVPL